MKKSIQLIIVSLLCFLLGLCAGMVAYKTQNNEAYEKKDGETADNKQSKDAISSILNGTEDDIFKIVHNDIHFTYSLNDSEKSQVFGLLQKLQYRSANSVKTEYDGYSELSRPLYYVQTVFGETVAVDVMLYEGRYLIGRNGEYFESNSSEDAVDKVLEFHRRTGRKVFSDTPKYSEGVRGNIYSSLQALKGFEEDLGLSGVDFNRLNIAAPVYSYQYKTEGITGKRAYYPLLLDGELKAFAIETFSGSGFRYQISTVEAKKVSELIKADTEFALVFDYDSLLLYDGTGVELVLGSAIKVNGMVDVSPDEYKNIRLERVELYSYSDSVLTVLE